LSWLSCEGNMLISLDLSNNPALTHLSCDRNTLTSLDISNDTSIYYLDLRAMPSLYKVCVWTMPFPPASVTVYTTDSPNVYFTMECN
jgi:hypothetical protein